MNTHRQQRVTPEKCPVCDADSTHLITHSLTGNTVSGMAHITCDVCTSTVLTFALQHDMGVVTVGLISDLTLQEAQHYLTQSSVNYEDVLGLYTATSRGTSYMKDLIT